MSDVLCSVLYSFFVPCDSCRRLTKSKEPIDYQLARFSRYQTESNRRKRFCRPSPSHSAMIPSYSDCKNTKNFNTCTNFSKIIFCARQSISKTATSASPKRRKTDNKSTLGYLFDTCRLCRFQNIPQSGCRRNNMLLLRNRSR